MKKIALIAFTTMLGACSGLPQKTVSGTYKGSLPCADCEKIDAELVLNSDKTYQYNTVYFKNKEQHPYIEKGNYIWDTNKSNVLRLNNSGNLTLLVTDSYVEVCDENGNPTKTKNNYKLQRIK
ncbi:copper resistance protein NlpE N-terminal domain-containing protein [Ursidibacter sp. B-7004-1]